MNKKLEMFDKFFNPERFEIESRMNGSNVVEETKISFSTKVVSSVSNTEDGRILSTPDHKLSREELIKKSILMFQ